MTTAARQKVTSLEEHAGKVESLLNSMQVREARVGYISLSLCRLGSQILRLFQRTHTDTWL